MAAGTQKSFYELKDKADELVLAALDATVLLAPYGTALPTKLIDEQGKLSGLDAGWQPVGEIDQKSAVELTPDEKVEGIQGYGSLGDRRKFVTESSWTIDFTAQETRVKTLEMFYDLDPVAEYKAGTGVQGQKRRIGKVKEYSALILFKDGDTDAEIYPWLLFPKVTITGRGKQTASMTDAITYGFTLTATEDPQEGALFKWGIGGPGFTKDLAQKMGFAVPSDS